MRVLLVDDEPDILDTVGEFLGLLPDVDVTRAANAEEALRLSSRAGFDLLMTDYRMPGMNGCELIQALKRRHGEFPAVIMTAFGASVREKEDCSGVVFDRILEKPATPDDLTRAIEDLRPA